MYSNVESSNEQNNHYNNNNRLDIRERSTTISLPQIYQENIDDNPSNSTGHVQQWINELQSNKKSRRSVSFDNTLAEKKRQSNLLTRLPNVRGDKKSKGITTESTFYRSRQNRTSSFSIISNSSKTSSRRCSISSNVNIEQENILPLISPIESSSSRISPIHNKDRLSSLQLNNFLKEIDQKHLNSIREIIPDELEKLVPILIRLGVLIIPQIFLQINSPQQITNRQLIERQRLILLMKKDEEFILYNNYLQHLYGNQSSNSQLLRESLSFQGQLALLTTFKDQIEEEFNEKIKYWKTIPMISSTTNSSLSPKRSFLQKTLENNCLIKLNFDDDPLNTCQPQHFDNQWKSKSISVVIEQGIYLLDKVRSLSSSILTNIYSNEQLIRNTIDQTNKQNLVKTFQKWFFLWSTLYLDD